ncbi:MAG: UpxY family transcription antiterminator [Candidatus Sulfotelmatobacter sp.]
MATSTQSCAGLHLVQHSASDDKQWYALLTRARHERAVAHRLQECGISTFLPLITQIHHWSDRKKVVELPLFDCYLFARLGSSRDERLRVARQDGVLSLVGARGEGTAVPDDQIETVRIVLQQQLSCSAHPFLKIGQRVRICSGALSGVEGILSSRNGDRSLVVSLDAIQRSLAIRLEGYEVEAA